MKGDSVEQRVLRVLLDGQLHHASEFIPITHRFSATIERLRGKNYDIQTLYLNGRNKAAWYQLLSVPAAA